jgi:OOP family OmpA-OmpF porin
MFQRSLVFAVALLASSVACTSFAQSSYIGGSAGSSAVKLNSSSNDFSTTATVKDESSSGYKAFIGRQLNDWLSVEGGYVDLGKATASYGSTSSVKVSVKNSAWFAALKGDVTHGAGFSGVG